ncbi:hypothetical protein HII31_00075 [Pseudocercospora fuligena]|uniref:Uncharacterized protein n=1 Tax=Pseudocercospora fuligena TaxID=685502 RepID=A0A8H6RY53_9PEZI|nr:hypothetical protein HII31_00075 [Pseudocercospora fuligena]
MALADSKPRSLQLCNWPVSQFSLAPITVKRTEAASIVFENLQEYCDISLLLSFKLQEVHAALVESEDVDIARRWLKKIPDEYQQYFTRLTITDMLRVVSTAHGAHTSRMHYKAEGASSGYLVQGSGTRISLLKFFADGETISIKPWTKEDRGTAKELFAKILDSVEGEWRRSEYSFHLQN